MFLDIAAAVHAAIGERFMFRYADGPEERLCRGLSAVCGILLFHASHKQKQPLSAVGACGNGLFQEILFVPEGLAAVHHGLGLGAQAVKKDRGGQDDPICRTDRSKDPGHVIPEDADAGLDAAAAILAGPDIQGIERIDRDVVACLCKRPERLVHQDLGVAAWTGASTKCDDFQR